MKIDLSRAHEFMNEAYWPLLYNQDRYLYLWGSAGSGKSHFLAQKFIIRAVSEPIHHRFLILRKTQPALRRSAFQLVRDYISKWGFYEDFRINKGDMFISNVRNGNEIYFIGMDDPEKIKSIENITSIWYEEASEADEEDILQLDIRLRPSFLLDEEQIARKQNKEYIGDYAQLCFSFNPISKHNWTYGQVNHPDYKSYRVKTKTKIQENSGKEKIITSHKTVFHSTYKDNKFLTDEYRATLESMIEKDETYYKIYCLGEYADLKNQVFTNYKTITAIPDNLKWDAVYYGLDFGYTHKTALLKVYEKKDNLYLQQIFYESKFTTQNLIDWLKEHKMNKHDPIYCDSAEPDRIQELLDAGYNVFPSYKSQNSVKDSIDCIKTYTMHILESDTDLLKELYLYKWQEVKRVDGAKVEKEEDKIREEPIGIQDDLMAALRYAVYTHYKEEHSAPHIRFFNI